MALEIGRHGIVKVGREGAVNIVRPSRNGGRVIEIAVPPELADEYRLAAGDIVEGDLEPLVESDSAWEEPQESEPDWDSFVEGPNAKYPPRAQSSFSLNRGPLECLVRVRRINGQPPEEAEDRPSARTRRSQSERTAPDRLLPVSDGPDDLTGRMLEFAAPLGAGVVGAIYGPHGSGLTATLQTVLHGIRTGVPDCVPMVLLLRPRAEEATEWRRRAPDTDIVVGQSSFTESLPAQTLEIFSLMLETAQRQTEMGRDVVLVVDSLTALWAALLEHEEADSQFEADTSAARNRLREWTQKAGCFHGPGPLGPGLGGSLTLLGTVWHQPIDIEAEEERDTHPHLRLLEHLLPDAGWLVALSESLRSRRLFPAIDIRNCRSQHEERLLPQDLLEPLLRARGSLPRNNPISCHIRVATAIEASTDMRGFLEALPDTEPEEEQAPATRPPDGFFIL